MATRSYNNLLRYFQKPPYYDIPSHIFQEKKYAYLHKHAISYMGYSVVTKRNCGILAEMTGHKPILEIMCGIGSYTYTLRSLGVSVIATDDYSWIDDDPKFEKWKYSPWISDIQRMDACSAIEKYGKNVCYILMSWPPMNENYAALALETMRKKASHCTMIYIGEEKGGVTANDNFFDIMTDVSHEYARIEDLRQSYHSWENNGFHDKQYFIR